MARQNVVSKSLVPNLQHTMTTSQCNQNNRRLQNFAFYRPPRL